MTGCGRAGESLFFFFNGLYITYVFILVEVTWKRGGNCWKAKRWWWIYHISRECKLCKEQRHCFQSNKVERQSRQKTGMDVVEYRFGVETVKLSSMVFRFSLPYNRWGLLLAVKRRRDRGLEGWEGDESIDLDI